MQFVVGLLLAVGVVASIAHFFLEPYNARFADHHLLVALHVIPGGLYLATAPIQYVPRFRQRSSGVHRWTGRVASLLALVSGVSAVLVGVVLPFAGILESMIVLLFGVYFVVAIAQGVAFARSHDYARHRTWMIRAFSIGLAISTIRMIYVPIASVLEAPTHETRQQLFVLTFLVSFSVHAAAAELYLRLGGRLGAKPRR